MRGARVGITGSWSSNISLAISPHDKWWIAVWLHKQTRWSVFLRATSNSCSAVCVWKPSAGGGALVAIEFNGDGAPRLGRLVQTQTTESLMKTCAPVCLRVPPHCLSSERYFLNPDTQGGWNRCGRRMHCLFCRQIIRHAHTCIHTQ